MFEERVSITDFNENEIREIVSFFSVDEFEFIDLNFLMSLYKINWESIKSGMDYRLVRPKLKTFSYDIFVIEHQTVERSYRHEIDSYDDSFVIPPSKLHYEEGFFSPL